MNNEISNVQTELEVENINLDEIEVVHKGLIRKTVNRKPSVTNFSLNNPYDVLTPEELVRRNKDLEEIDRQSRRQIPNLLIN